MPPPALTSPRVAVASKTSLPITPSTSNAATLVSTHLVPSQPRIVPKGPSAFCNLSYATEKSAILSPVTAPSARRSVLTAPGAMSGSG